MRKNQLSLALLLSLCLSAPLACNKERASTKQKTADTAQGAQKPDTKAGDHDEKEEEEGGALTAGFLELRLDKVREGLTTPSIAAQPISEQRAALKKAAGDTRKSVGAPLPFTRLVGGEGFYCGTLKNGPLRCWGARDDFVAGGFIDVAIAGREACAVTADGRVKCLDAKAPNLSNIKRIAGGGSVFCALERSGKVHCFGAGPGIPSPSGLKARYIAVASQFACAANGSGVLECWGPDVPAGMPQGKPIKDLASTSHGMCLLTSEQQIKCFGENIDMGTSKFASINGGVGTICGKKLDSDVTVCKGLVNQTYEKQSQRVAVASETVCALTPDGSPDCIGIAFGAEISIPRAKAPEPLVKKDPLFDEFLALFPEGKLPFDMTRKASFVLGDQIPEKFYNFLEIHPSKYRIVAKFNDPAPSVIVLEWGSGSLHLFTYDQFGAIVRHRGVASLGPGWTGRDAMQHADGSSTDAESVHSTESTLFEGGKLETTKYDRYETIHHLAQKKDGKHAISRIECVISGASSTDQIQADGSIKRLSAKVLPSHAETDLDGCAKKWPSLRL